MGKAVLVYVAIGGGLYVAMWTAPQVTDEQGCVLQDRAQPRDNYNQVQRTHRVGRVSAVGGKIAGE
jgi:hypothetical protein